MIVVQMMVWCMIVVQRCSLMYDCGTGGGLVYNCGISYFLLFILKPLPLTVCSSESGMRCVVSPVTRLSAQNTGLRQAGSVKHTCVWDD